MKGSPHQLVGVPSRALHFRGAADVAADAAPEEEGLGDSVGGVEGRDADGEDDVEGGGGAEVDDADEAGDDGDDVDGVEGDGCVGVDLVDGETQ